MAEMTGRKMRMERVGDHFEFLSRAQGVPLDQVKQFAHRAMIHPTARSCGGARSVHLACINPSPPCGMCERWSSSCFFQSMCRKLPSSVMCT